MIGWPVGPWWGRATGCRGAKWEAGSPGFLFSPPPGPATGPGPPHLLAPPPPNQPHADQRRSVDLAAHRFGPGAKEGPAGPVRDRTPPPQPRSLPPAVLLLARTAGRERHKGSAMSGLARAAGKAAVGAAAAPAQGSSAGALIQRLNSRYDELHREFEDGAWPREPPPGGVADRGGQGGGLERLTREARSPAPAQRSGRRRWA